MYSKHLCTISGRNVKINAAHLLCFVYWEHASGELILHAHIRTFGELTHKIVLQMRVLGLLRVVLQRKTLSNMSGLSPGH